MAISTWESVTTPKKMKIKILNRSIDSFKKMTSEPITNNEVLVFERKEISFTVKGFEGQKMIGFSLVNPITPLSVIFLLESQFLIL
jgi:hypothetical protein